MSEARTRVTVLSLLLFLPALLLWQGCAKSGNSSAGGGGGAGLSKIQHIVFIVKENRTFDNYFGQFPGANGATKGTLSTGQQISLSHTPDQTTRDIDHGYKSAVTAIDSG